MQKIGILVGIYWFSKVHLNLGTFCARDLLRLKCSTVKLRKSWYRF